MHIDKQRTRLDIISSAPRSRRMEEGEGGDGYPHVVLLGFTYVLLALLLEGKFHSCVSFFLCR